MTLRGLAPAWRPWSSWLASWAPREVPFRDLSASSRASLMRPHLRKLRVVHPARLGPSRGSWVCVDEDGPCWAPFEPRRRSQAGKSGDPRSQNADSSPLAQGAPGLGRAERRKGEGEAPRALTACGLGRRVAVDWTWAALFPPAPLFCALLGGLVVVHNRSPSCCSSVLCSFSLRTPAPASNPISNLPC